MPRYRRSLIVIPFALLAVAASALRFAGTGGSWTTTLIALPGAILLVLLVLGAIWGGYRARALRRVAALQEAHPGALVLSCYVPAGFGQVLDEAGWPGDAGGPVPSNVYAAAVVDAHGVALFRGGARPRRVRTLPAAAVTGLRVERAQASPLKLVPSLIIGVRTPRSGEADVALQLAEWNGHLLPRFGDEAHVEARADEVRRALGLPAPSASAGSGSA